MGGCKGKEVDAKWGKKENPLHCVVIHALRTSVLLILLQVEFIGFYQCTWHFVRFNAGQTLVNRLIVSSGLFIAIAIVKACSCIHIMYAVLCTCFFFSWMGIRLNESNQCFAGNSELLICAKFFKPHLLLTFSLSIKYLYPTNVDHNSHHNNTFPALLELIFYIYSTDIMYIIWLFWYLVIIATMDLKTVYNMIKLEFLIQRLLRVQRANVAPARCG